MDLDAAWHAYSGLKNTYNAGQWAYNFATGSGESKRKEEKSRSRKRRSDSGGTHKYPKRNKNNSHSKEMARKIVRNALALKRSGHRRFPFRKITRKFSRKRRSLSAPNRGKSRNGNTKNKGLPGWFKTLARQQTPIRVDGRYSAALHQIAAITTISLATNAIHQRALGIDQIWSAMNCSIAANSAAVAANNANKIYISDIVRMHEWRNNCSHATVHVTFYSLSPRRDFPVNSTTGALLTMVPPVTNNENGGGSVVNPTLLDRQLSDMGLANAGAIYTNKITQEDIQWTPFMVPGLASLFKIKLLKVQGPTGIKAAHVLQPGEQCMYLGKRRKPYMCSFNKYGLDAHQADSIQTLYVMLKETGFILVHIHGTPAHDASNPLTRVAEGESSLDYVQKWRFKLWNFQTQIPQTVNVTANTISFAGAAEQTDVVTAVEGPQLEN